MKGKLLSSRVLPEFFQLVSSDRVLNIGSGDAPQAIVYNHKFREMVGIEINEERAKRLLDIASFFGVKNFLVINDNVESIPLPDKSFDKIIAIDIIEHVIHPEKLCVVMLESSEAKR